MTDSSNPSEHAIRIPNDLLFHSVLLSVSNSWFFFSLVA